MEIFYRNQANATILILLIFVFAVAYKKLDRKDLLNRAFLWTALGVMLGLFSESTTDILDGHSNPFIMFLNASFSVLLFIVAPFMAFNFFFFIYHIVFPGKHVSKTLWLIFGIPIISNVIIANLSPFYGLFFEISSTGVYSRGPLWLLSAFSTYIYIAAGIIMVLINRRRMLTQDFWLILGIGFIPVAGAIIQTLYFGVLTMWNSAGIALLISYLFLQDRLIHLDQLTGAWTRETFYNNYSRKIQMSPDKHFGALYFDIDNLKDINDTYGHLEGDNAIKLAIKIINENLDKGGTICRLGGDEFIVLCDCTEEDDIKSVLARIKQGFIDDPDAKSKPYHLECSFSAALYTSEYTSLDAFLSRLDYLMYQEKFAKRDIE